VSCRSSVIFEIQPVDEPAVDVELQLVHRAERDGLGGPQRTATRRAAAAAPLRGRLRDRRGEQQLGAEVDRDLDLEGRHRRGRGVEVAGRRRVGEEGGGAPGAVRAAGAVRRSPVRPVAAARAAAKAFA
jgi:hypothetical protein